MGRHIPIWVINRCKLGRSPSDVLFVSDIVAELDAARAAGMQTALCVRAPACAPEAGAHRVIGGFAQLMG